MNQENKSLEISNKSFFEEETIYQDIFKPIILKSQRGKIYDLISKKTEATVSIKAKKEEELNFNGIFFVEEVVVKVSNNSKIEMFYLAENSINLSKAQLTIDSEANEISFKVNDFIKMISFKNTSIFELLTLNALEIRGLEKNSFKTVLDFANQKTYEYEKMKNELLKKENSLIQTEAEINERNTVALSNISKLKEETAVLENELEESNEQLANLKTKSNNEKSIIANLAKEEKEKRENISSYESKIITLKNERSTLESSLKELRMAKSNYTEDLSGLQSLFDKQLNTQFVVFGLCLLLLSGALFYVLKNGYDLYKIVISSNTSIDILKIYLLVGIKLVTTLTIGVVSYFIEKALSKSYLAIREIQKERSESLKLAALIKHAVDSVIIPDNLSESELQIYQDRLIQFKMAYLRSNQFNTTISEELSTINQFSVNHSQEDLPSVLN